MKGIKIFLDREIIGSAGMEVDGNIALLLTLQISDGVLQSTSEIQIMGYCSQSKKHRDFLTRRISGKEIRICYDEISETEIAYNELDLSNGDNR